MALHRVRIIESGDFSTLRLFQLGLSFARCKSKGLWPSLSTMNSFLRGGIDDGALGTDIEWDPCEISQAEYTESIRKLMDGEPFVIDASECNWDEWVEKLK